MNRHDVVWVQLRLKERGYPLVADGLLGPKTKAAMADFAEEHDLPWEESDDYSTSSEAMVALGKEPATVITRRVDSYDTSRFVLPGDNFTEKLPDVIKVYDLTDIQKSPIPRSRVRRGKTVMREPSEVTGLTLHQMACVFGTSNAQVKAAHGDVELARATRMLNVPAHACSMTTGSFVIHSPMAAYLHHGHGFNSDTIALEVEGGYAGVGGDPRTMWRPEKTTPLSDLSIVTARAACYHIVTEARQQGMNLKWLYSHRQTYANKTSDPGSEIWIRVGLQYCVGSLGLRPRNDHTRRDGHPIPHEWDPHSREPYR